MLEFCSANGQNDTFEVYRIYGTQFYNNQVGREQKLVDSLEYDISNTPFIDERNKYNFEAKSFFKVLSK